MRTKKSAEKPLTISKREVERRKLFAEIVSKEMAKPPEKRNMNFERWTESLPGSV